MIALNSSDTGQVAVLSIKLLALISGSSSRSTCLHSTTCRSRSTIDSFSLILSINQITSSNWLIKSTTCYLLCAHRWYILAMIACLVHQGSLDLMILSTIFHSVQWTVISYYRRVLGESTIGVFVWGEERSLILVATSGDVIGVVGDVCDRVVMTTH